MDNSEKIQKWRRSIEPRNIFDFVPRDTLEAMIDGFYLKCEVGMTLRWAEYNENNDWWEFLEDDDITPKPGDEQNKPRNFCGVVRSENFDMNQGCRDCDRDKAQKLVEKIKNGERLEEDKCWEYQCWMGFTDYVFPLTIGHGNDKKVVAVLFGGQIVFSEDQKKRIIANLRKNRDKIVSQEKITEYEGLLEEEFATPQKNVKALVEEVSNLLQGFFDSLYDLQVQKAQGEYFQHLEEQLIQLEETQSEKWSLRLKGVIQDFCKLVGLRDIDVYIRSKRFFEMIYPYDYTNEARNESDFSKAGRFLLTDYHDFLNRNCNRSSEEDREGQLHYLLPITIKDYWIAQKCNVSLQHTWLYYCDYGVKNNRQTMLLVARGSTRETFNTIRDTFCSSISRIVAIYSLLETLANRQEEFEYFTVRQVHQINTSRSIADKCLERLDRNSEDFGDEIQTLRDILGEDGRISMRLSKLTDNLGIKKKNLELTSTIKVIIQNLEPKARAIPCRISLEGDWNSPIHVYATEQSINDIFENILDNAIKYSFRDEIIQVEQYIKGMEVRVDITNYGIGIPDKTKRKIYKRVPFTRSNVHDPARDDRTGTGLGLVIAQDELENCNGTLKIDSKPPRRTQSMDNQDYLSWTTIVTVTLPTTSPPKT